MGLTFFKNFLSKLELPGTQNYGVQHSWTPGLDALRIWSLAQHPRIYISTYIFHALSSRLRIFHSFPMPFLLSWGQEEQVVVFARDPFPFHSLYHICSATSQCLGGFQEFAGLRNCMDFWCLFRSEFSWFNASTDFLHNASTKWPLLPFFYFFDVFCPRLYRLLNFIGIVDIWSSRLSVLPAENLDGFEMFWMCRITAFCVSRNVPYQQEQGDFAFEWVVDRESYWLWLERAWLPNVLRHHMVSFIRELDPDQDSDLHCFTFICIYNHLHTCHRSMMSNIVDLWSVSKFLKRD